MKNFALLLCAALAAVSPTMLHANTMGTTVSGDLNFTNFSGNYFDPAQGFVPVGYGNAGGDTSVVIGSGPEFGVSDGNILYTFDFNASTLHFTNTTQHSTTENSFVASFTDPAFTGASLLSSTVDGLDYSFSGDTLTLNFAGHLDSQVNGNLGQAVFLIQSTDAQTPEPSTFALLGTGALGVIGGIRRRLS